MKIYTDASKQIDNITGIGITDTRRIQKYERLPDAMQISNAELVAILKAIFIFKNSPEMKLVILTDSLTGCEWIVRGLHNNYIVHLIREKIGGLEGKEVNI